MFDQYVKTRAEEERREKKNKIMQAKEDFKKMMEEAKFNPRYVFYQSRLSMYFSRHQECVCGRVRNQVIPTYFVDKDSKQAD